MSKIVVTVGHEEMVGTAGAYNSRTKQVKFNGEKLASDEDSRQATRGTDTGLYRTDKGKYLIHKHNWTKWQGEGDSWTLEEVSEADLAPNGKYGNLGKQAGLHDGEIDIEDYLK